MPVYYPPQAISIPPPPVVAGKQTLWVPAGACLRTRNNGAATLDSVAIASDRPDLIGIFYADNADQIAQFEVALPKQWNLGTVTTAIHWTVNGGSSGSITWEIKAVAISDNDSINTAFGSAVSISDGFLGDKREHITPESSPITIGNSPQTGDRIIFQVTRKGIADSLATHAYLLGLRIFYTTSAATDD